MKSVRIFLVLFSCIVFSGFFAYTVQARGVRNVVPYNIGSTEKGEDDKAGLEAKIQAYKKRSDTMSGSYENAYGGIPQNMRDKKFSGNRDAYLYFEKHHYSLKRKNNKTAEEKKLEENYYLLQSYYYINSEIDRMEKKLKKYK